MGSFWKKISPSLSDKLNNALKNSSISSSEDDLTIGGDNDPVVRDLLERQRKEQEEVERQKNIITTNENFVNDSPNDTKNETENNNIWLWLLGGVVVVGGGFLLFGGKKKKKRK